MSKGTEIARLSRAILFCWNPVLPQEKVVARGFNFESSPVNFSELALRELEESTTEHLKIVLEFFDEKHAVRYTNTRRGTYRHFVTTLVYSILNAEGIWC